MQPQVFLITPPFTQLNTPYPATAYLKGFLNTHNIPSYQCDLGIDVLLRLFSAKGLERLFKAIADKKPQLAPNEQRILKLQHEYIRTIDRVIDFLQDKNPTLAHLICTGNYLPEASRFDQLADLEWAFGTMGIRDKARHLATLYLEDLSDLIVAAIDPYFGFSRYAERLGQSAATFDHLYHALQQQDTFIDLLLFEILEEKLEGRSPLLVAISAPFPGNLYSAFKCGQWFKKHHPGIKICLGGGYANTELRSVSDPRVFEFLDFIALDDGEATLIHLLEHLEGKRPLDFLKRTFSLYEGAVTYFNASLLPDYKQKDTGTPDYSDLPINDYLSVIEIANPMHRLWSDGRWNKLTLAHGCYWGKCTFCDISLDYIKNYEAAPAILLVDRIEELISQTGQNGFHFVDEAAPPALMKAVALEIIKRKLTVVWWTNIRFEKSFTYDLCALLAASGCIAVSGGLEVASDRLLSLINKGVTVSQVAKVTDHFTANGIMVHAYLMYGFPTQTEQETIDALEMVRQLFQAGIIQSGFWHEFAMTAHSPVGMNPELYQVARKTTEPGTFANNDLEHIDATGTRHEKFSEGLRKSLFNYMHGICFDFPLQEWFDFKIPRTTINPHYIEQELAGGGEQNWKPSTKLVWLEGPPEIVTRVHKRKGRSLQQTFLSVSTRRREVHIETTPEMALFLKDMLNKTAITQEHTFSIAEIAPEFETRFEGRFLDLLHTEPLLQLRETGLLLL